MKDKFDHYDQCIGCGRMAMLHYWTDECQRCWLGEG